jgi:hypothetical protein
MKQTLQRIENIKKNGFYFSFGELLEQTFNNYKKIALVQGLVLLVVIIIFTVVVGSVAGIALGIGTITQYFTDIEVNEVTSVSLIVNFAVTVVAAGIGAPFTAGLLKMAHEAEENRNVEFSIVFDYYKSIYFKDLFIAGIVISTFSSGFSTIISLLTQEFTSGVSFYVLTLVSGILNIVIPILTIFAVPLIVFGNLTSGQAIKKSIEIARTKFWTILLVLLVLLICAFVGLFAFCIGIFFTIPLIYSGIYIMYRTSIGIVKKSEMDDIGMTVL